MEGWIGGSVVAWTFQPWTSCHGPSLTVDEEDGLVGWVVVPPTMEKHCAMRPPVKGIAMWQHFCRCPHEQFSTHILYFRISVVVYNFVLQKLFTFCRNGKWFTDVVCNLQRLWTKGQHGVSFIWQLSGHFQEANFKGPMHNWTSAFLHQSFKNLEGKGVYS